MFSKLNFIVPLNPTDKVLKIRNINGLVVHMIKDPFCTIKQEGVNIYIKQAAESNTLTLNFATIIEATEAHVLLRDALAILSINLGFINNSCPPQPCNIIPPISSCCDDDCDPNRHPVLLTDIWTQSNLIPNVAPLATSGVVQKFVDFQLNWDNGTARFIHPSFIDIIPPYFGDNISYNFILKTWNNIIIPYGWQNWKVDLDCGRVTFKNGFVSSGPIVVDSTHPPKISFYKYVGNKGVFTGGGNTLQIGFYPPTTTVGIDQDFTVPVGIQQILEFYVNGQLIDNNIITQYVLTPSITAPTTITWKGSADFILENTDVVTIIYK